MDAIHGEIVGYWRGIVATLHQRGLLRDRSRQGGKVLPQADAILLPDRCIFALDLHRLGGIPREAWLSPELWAQWRATLQGRRVIVSDGAGLFIQVGRRPDKRTAKRLPQVIPLDLEAMPEGAYTVTLGYTKAGAVTLDLAETHRAILTGGTSGSGKTNLMQSIVLQLAARHSPDEFQVAIVDTKEVDFGRDYEGLPHLYASIAHNLQSAAELVEQVEAERLRRQAVMAKAGVVDWREMPEGAGLPLLLLIVDEAADFARTPAMETLVNIARKGRAMGISLILGTQSPSSKVIDPQVRANLPTAIAFQTRTDVESRVILGCKGAEELNRPGLALAFVDGKWQTVQTLRVDREVAQALAGQVAALERAALGEVETDLVRYAVQNLGGAFVVNQLYEQFAGQISKRRLTTLAQQWESRGWLTAERRDANGHRQGRQVTLELLALASPVYDSQDR
ncbi:MAG: DNA translocase FtsK [Anaerolineae bacterium]|nr:DNA translocase FtsK [Anaerolineae bacterium]